MLSARDIRHPETALRGVLDHADAQLRQIPRLLMLARSNGLSDATLRTHFGEPAWELVEQAIARARHEHRDLPALAEDRRYVDDRGNVVVVRDRDFGRIWYESPDGQSPSTTSARKFHITYRPATPRVRMDVRYRLDGDLIKVVAMGNRQCQCHILDEVTGRFLTTRIVTREELLERGEVVEEPEVP